MMVKKAQLITNVMDRLTQAVVIGFWLLRKVVMSNHPINKENHTTTQEKTKPSTKTNQSLYQTNHKKCGSKEREQRWRGMERKVDEWREKNKTGKSE